MSTGLFLCPACERFSGLDLAREASRTEALLMLAEHGIHLGDLEMFDYRMERGKVKVSMPREEYLKHRASLLPFQDDCRLSATAADFRFKPFSEKLVRSWQTIFGKPSP